MGILFTVAFSNDFLQIKGYKYLPDKVLGLK